MKKAIDTIADASDAATRVAVILLLAAMVVIISLEVIFRYVLKLPLVWSEQLASYTMIWLAFLSAAIALREHAHIGMTLLVNRLPDKGKKAVEIVSHLLILIFLAFLIWWGIKHALDVRNQRSPVVFNISMFWPYLALPVGAILMVIQEVKIIVSGPWSTDAVSTLTDNGIVQP